MPHTPEGPKLIRVTRDQDILPAWRDTPIGDLLRYHNLHAPRRDYQRAELLIGMCMDNRKTLRVPDNFAFILRAGGANFRRMEFKVSLVVALGGVNAMCIMGHSDCQMVGLRGRREKFIEGLVRNGGWSVETATREFDDHVAEFDIDNGAAFVRREATRLRLKYPGLTIAPLFYTVEDALLHQVVDD